MNIHCGFTGTGWVQSYFSTFEEAIAYLKTLCPAANRPNHIFLEGATFDQFAEVIKILYVPQIFILQDGALIGGFPSTRKYLCRLFKYKDGGNIPMQYFNGAQ